MVEDDDFYKESAATVDEIFLSIIQDNPKYLQDYPQLMVEYALDNGHVRNKNADELTETLMQNLDNDNIYNYILNILDGNSKKEKGESYS